MEVFRPPSNALGGLLALTAAVFAPAALAQTNGATPPPALGIVGGESAQSVVFDEADKLGKVADLALAVNVPEGAEGRLRLSFVATGPDAPIRPIRVQAKAPAKPYPATHPAVFADPLPPKLHTEANILRLSFGLAADADPRAATGLLRITVVKGAVLEVPVTASAAKAAFQPATVEMQVTEQFLWWNRTGTAETVTVTGPGRDAVAGGPEVTATLPASNGGSAEASLSFPDPDSYEGEVEVNSYSGNGTYNGAIVVDPTAETPTSLTVKVNVRDSIIWPILLVLLGGTVGYFMRVLYGHHHRREVLRSALKDAHNLYVQKGSETGGPELYDLADELGPRPFFPSYRDRDTDVDRGKFGKLYADIHKAEDDAQFKDVTTRTNALLASFAAWQETRAAVAELDRAEVSAGTLGPAARADTAAVWLSVQSQPPAHVLAEAIARVRRQAQLLRAYGRVDRRLDELEQAEPGSRERLVKYAPERLYSDSRKAEADPPGPEAELDAAAVWHMLNVFDAALDALTKDPPPADPPGVKPVVGAEETRRVATVHVQAGDRGGTEGEPTAVAIEVSAERPPAQDSRSSARILSGLRVWDFWLSAATALVVATAYVAGVYNQDPAYGGFLTLLGAFAAGLAGETVAKGFAAVLGQLPFGRSYRPEAEAPPAAPPAA